MSSVQLQVDVADKIGRMDLHIHDSSDQPVLLSVKAQRNLGAIIDFEKCECIFSKVDKHAVVKLETASNGHVHVLMLLAQRRRTPFDGLSTE